MTFWTWNYKFNMLKICIALLFLTDCCLGEILFVQTVCRHGDRAPIHVYPNYEHRDYWATTGWGRLSALGAQQCFDNGKMYRKHYRNLVSQTYDPQEFVARSSNIDRAITSGEAFAAGFFADAGYMSKVVPDGQEGPKFRPYPVHAISPEIDYYLANAPRICPVMAQLARKHTESKAYKLLVAEHQDMIGHIADKAGFLIHDWTLSNINHLTDTTICDKAHDLSLPEWLDDETFKNVSLLTEKSREINSKNLEVQRLQVGGGPFVHLIMENLRSYVNESSTTAKFRLFYAHDTTLLGFLSNIRYHDLRSNPEYTTCINFELHRKKDKLLVDVFYKNETANMNMVRLAPKGCPADTSCAWTDFETAMSEIEVKDVQQACKPTDIVLEMQFTKASLIVLTLAFFITLFTILMIAYSCGRNAEANSHSITMSYEPLKFMQDI